MTRCFGLILAGGQARRMAGVDKPLIEIGGAPILEHLVRRLAPQCVGLALNANGDPERFAGFGLPIVADDVAGFAGPLAGVLAGLDHIAAAHPDIDLALSVPADTPFVPPDLVARLAAARAASGAEIAVASSGGARASRGRALARRAARGVATCARAGGHAQGERFHRALSERARRMACRALRSVLQRQSAGGCRDGRGDRAADARK